MDVQKFREVLKRRDETHSEYTYGLEMCWKEEVEILAEDMPSTIEYLKNECTTDELFGEKIAFQGVDKNSIVAI